MALPKKGTMIPVKKVLGSILLIISILLMFKQELAMQYIAQYMIAFNIVLLIAGYFLFISGRRFNQR